MLKTEDQRDRNAFTPRQSAVLESALQLLVEGGEKALTTAGVARAANCSKESLYKWFGDRDGLLAAVIAHQAGKVRVSAETGASADAKSVEERLVTFGADLLTVLAGEPSLALNRLAIGQASKDDNRLGRMLLERGRGRIETQARALLERGRHLGYLRFDDVEEAYRMLYGLIVGDLHIRLLLGDGPCAAEKDFRLLARRAVQQFFRLYAGDRYRADPSA